MPICRVDSRIVPVGQVVAVPLEVLGQVVGGLGDPGADDETEPVVLQRHQVRRGEHPGVSGHDHVSYGVAVRNGVRTGIRVVVSALLPSNRCTSRGNPGGSTEPDGDLRVDPVFLAHPDLAQFVLVVALEVQRRHVVEHQGGGAARADRVRQAAADSCRRSRGAASGPGNGTTCAGSRPARRSHPGPARPRPWRSAPRWCQDHRAEPVIAQDVEPQPRIGAGQDRRADSGRPHDPPARSDGGGTPTGRRHHRLRGNSGSPVQSATSSIRAGTTGKSPRSRTPCPGNSRSRAAASSNASSASVCADPRARPARPAGPGA